jgi:Mn2+/Fe2+ NRAMP family transporter
MNARSILQFGVLMIIVFSVAAIAQSIDIDNAIAGTKYVNKQIFDAGVKIVGIVLFLLAAWYAWDGYHKEQLTDRLVKIIGMVIFIAFLQLLPYVWYKFTKQDAVEGYTNGVSNTK